MKEEIEKRIVVLEAEIKQHEKDYMEMPTVICSKQGAVIELKKLIEPDKE